MGFLRSLFGREQSSAQLAKQRLQVVLVQDHLALPPGTMEAIKTDIVAVISRHLDIEPAGVEVAFERRGHSDELVASIPVRRNTGLPRRSEVLPRQRAAPVAARPAAHAGGRPPRRRRR